MQAAPFKDYATYCFGRFACAWKETGEVIGFSGLKYVPEISDAEPGYRFFPEPSSASRWRSSSAIQDWLA